MRFLHQPGPLLLVIALLLTGCASGPDVSQRGDQDYTPVYQPTTEADNDRIAALEDVFARYEGTPYRYGGTNARGFDCSGFIGRAYQEAFGMELPRTTSQLLDQGDYVPPDQLRPGDVVFFNIRGKESHAGIFMGGDDFIHASTSVGVTQSSLNGYYWRGRMTQARRFD
ncbi:C40 family peptidase [Marinobacter sp. M1N3S26]|uniref:C40 family peptidase n=1 Tax=unclassified Marinobacter TaxID=83889 RepID=UPI00387B608A